MKMTLQERYAALRVLPQETNFKTLKIVRDLQDVLAPTEEEIKKFKIVERSYANGSVSTTWDKEFKETEVEIKFGQIAEEVIREALEKLEKTNKLTQEHLTLYEKIVEVDKTK